MISILFGSVFRSCVNNLNKKGIKPNGGTNKMVNNIIILNNLLKLLFAILYMPYIHVDATVMPSDITIIVCI